MNKYWIPGPITNYGTTDAGFCDEVRVVLAADYDAYCTRAHEDYRTQNDEIVRLQAQLLEANEKIAFLESKEVCTVAHSDEVLEFCPYCKIERLQAALNVCPDCHGKGGTLPNGVQYCNCIDAA